MPRLRMRIQRLVVRSVVMAGVMVVGGLVFQGPAMMWVLPLLFVVLFLMLRPI